MYVVKIGLYRLKMCWKHERKQIHKTAELNGLPEKPIGLGFNSKNRTRFKIILGFVWYVQWYGFSSGQVSQKNCSIHSALGLKAIVRKPVRAIASRGQDRCSYCKFLTHGTMKVKQQRSSTCIINNKALLSTAYFGSPSPDESPTVRQCCKTTGTTP